MTTQSRSVRAGIIDADGHIAEPPDLWEKYLEPQYRERAIGIRPGPDGRDHLVIDGHLSRFFNADFLIRGTSMGRNFEERAAITWKSYRDSIPFGAGDAKERMELLDREGLAKTLVYPTIALLWESEVEDPELALAYCRAYNRWIVDFCSDSGGRLVPIAQISMGDGWAAARELQRAVESGAKGAFVAPFTITDKSHAHPDYDPFWAAAQNLDIPIGIHPVAEPPNRRVFQRFREMHKWGEWWDDLLGGQGPQQAFLALFQYGLFDRFPGVKVVLLESGAGWIGYMLERMDAAHATAMGRTVRLEEKPSFYFHRQCWISADPEERAVSYIIDYIGRDKFFWASDFPHDDHASAYMQELEQCVAPLSEETRRGILGENVARVYGLGKN